MIIVCHTIQRLCFRFARSPIDASAAAVSVACASPGASAACAPAAAVAAAACTAAAVAASTAAIAGTAGGSRDNTYLYVAEAALKAVTGIVLNRWQ